MMITKLHLNTIIICLILFLAISCNKKEENEKPRVSFLQPVNNLVITNDTLISFIVEALDNDGLIDKVEFSKNGTIVQTVVNPPYKFDWLISTENNLGIYIVKATAYDNDGATAESEIQIEIKSYLTRWLGIYEGTSHHWVSYPTEINGQWQITTYHTYNNVLVNVAQSSQDSCLDLAITYHDTINGSQNGLKFSVSGTHSSQWGGGSSQGSLDIHFDRDSLKYNYFQKCGIPCSSGIDFVIGMK